MSTSPVTHYPEGIWIERIGQLHQTLWDTSYSEAYTLVNDAHQPILDEHHQEYRFDTLAQAEQRIRELLVPALNALAQAYERAGAV